MLTQNTNQNFNITANPLKSARNILHQLWDHLGQPQLDNFFPIKVDEITKSILGWYIEEVPSIGQAQYGNVFSGEPILGKIDFENKIITLNVDDTTQGERNYTMAHEIGHLVLHQNIVSCHVGSALRKRSVRKLKYQYNNTANRKIEREADIFAYELLMPKKAMQTHFIKLFDRESVRASSSFVKDLQDEDNMRSSRNRFQIDQSSTLSVARFLATYKNNSDIRSLTEFFGVSIEAMSKRLVELVLVY
jgi:hypothetical protein